jgi:hypothetical protein
MAPEPSIDLAGRRAMVIGAEFPVGGAIALALAEAGADVAVAALQPDESVLTSRKVKRAIEAMGRRSAEYVMDVMLGRNVQVTTRQIAKEMGGLDLVVSAGELPLEVVVTLNHEGRPGLAAVASAQAGARQLVPEAAAEFAEAGVRVNGIVADAASDALRAAALELASSQVTGEIRDVR